MANGDLRFQHRDEVEQAITDWTTQHTKTEVMEAIAGEKVRAVPSTTPMN